MSSEFAFEIRHKSKLSVDRTSILVLDNLKNSLCCNKSKLLRCQTISRKTVDLKGEYIEHIHLLSGDLAGWNNLNLVYEIEPAGEMPPTKLEQHGIIICLGDFRASF